jgi:hypothetical protein
METPSEMSVLLELIRIYMKEHNNPLEREQLKEEAQRLANQLEKQSAGRVFEQSPEEREESFKKIDAYYKDKREWNKLFQPRVRKSAAGE